MVNAMAPNAPIGATRTMMRMMPKNNLAAASTTALIFSPIAPKRAITKPERMDTSSTCRISPRASAPKKLSGMIANRWPTTPSCLAAVT